VPGHLSPQGGYVLLERRDLARLILFAALQLFNAKLAWSFAEDEYPLAK
jgi:hypothetical protein